MKKIFLIYGKLYCMVNSSSITLLSLNINVSSMYIMFTLAEERRGQWSVRNNRSRCIGNNWANLRICGWVITSQTAIIWINYTHLFSFAMFMRTCNKIIISNVMTILQNIIRIFKKIIIIFTHSGWEYSGDIAPIGHFWG